MAYHNPLVAYIDSHALEHNINAVKNKYPGKEIILPVKANAYGHGSVLISRLAQDCGITFFALARINEALELRHAGIKGQMLVLGAEWDPDNIKLASEYNIGLTVSCAEHIELLEKIAEQENTVLQIHVKLNTGMFRLGIDREHIALCAEKLSHCRKLHVVSAFTHFAKSDESIETTLEHIKMFGQSLEILNTSGVKPDFYHLCNSGGVENISDDSNDIIRGSFAVRPGIMVYGYSQAINGRSEDELIPVMNLCSKVVHTRYVKKGTPVGYGAAYIVPKDGKLATLALGYGDGFPRALSGKFPVRINQHDYMQRGRISMDLTVIDADENVHVGDSAWIFGSSKYAQMNAADLARICGTISYEITTSVASRVERRVI
ncbi:MAG: alanine racemase [Spirochaetales bacterium]|nr:alanine racemase [Spirochaetales bacterium]